MYVQVQSLMVNDRKVNYRNYFGAKMPIKFYVVDILFIVNNII